MDKMTGRYQQQKRPRNNGIGENFLQMCKLLAFAQGKKTSSFQLLSQQIRDRPKSTKILDFKINFPKTETTEQL